MDDAQHTPFSERSSLVTGALALFASTGTLVCCALPALLVALGAGAVLSTLVSAVPALVWISDYKEAVFAFAALMLALGGAAKWRARHAHFPIDPVLRASCLRTRRVSLRVYLFSVAVFLTGGWFAYGMPLLV